MNLPTVVILALTIGAFAAIVIGRIRRRKKGGCSCSCGHCSGDCRHT